MDPATIGAAAVIFTAVIMGLVAMILGARSQLVAQGDVSVFINGNPDLTVKVAPGQSLLSALGSQKVFIPSACGGGGTCAQCKCIVLDGGGDVLPTELPNLSLAERKQNVRLSCQVKVKQDLKLKLPEEIFGVKKFTCKVISNDNVATFIKELKLQLPEPMDCRPGDYIQIDVPRYELDYNQLKDNIADEYKGDWDRFNVWDAKAFNREDGIYRAYSMANYPAEGDIAMFNIRIASPPPRGPKGLPGGVCSSWVFSLKAGDEVTVGGPFGEFHLNEGTGRPMIYIGGGAGMAPLRSHIFHMFRVLQTGREIHYWYGARSPKEVFYWDEFKALEAEFPNFKCFLALSNAEPEDNWTGLTGFIHQVLFDEYLKDHEAPEDIEYYICGPPLMFKAVRGMLDNLGVPEEMVRFDDFG